MPEESEILTLARKLGWAGGGLLSPTPNFKELFAASLSATDAERDALRAAWSKYQQNVKRSNSPIQPLLPTAGQLSVPFGMGLSKSYSKRKRGAPRRKVRSGLLAKWPRQKRKPGPDYKVVNDIELETLFLRLPKFHAMQKGRKPTDRRAIEMFLEEKAEKEGRRRRFYCKKQTIKTIQNRLSKLSRDIGRN